MNKDVLRGKWKQLKGEVQNRWGKLTGDDLEAIEGDASKLVGRVQERYGYTREKAEQEVEEFMDKQAA